jgi:protein tyrosine phosphatase
MYGMIMNVCCGCLSVKKTDYINASLVEVGDVNRRYILTQGPLANTVAHFWALVWEQVRSAALPVAVSTFYST